MVYGTIHLKFCALCKTAKNFESVISLGGVTKSVSTIYNVRAGVSSLSSGQLIMEQRSRSVAWGLSWVGWTVGCRKVAIALNIHEQRSLKSLSINKP
ncbi:hypothetical protein JYQ62_22745 [Nostoc sp. UHCC 0702]|nr:hypothetical protein JYQ62_22745 [Nostoc sp. UHCC 0702]